jgi:hypothetical protein
MFLAKAFAFGQTFGRIKVSCQQVEPQNQGKIISRNLMLYTCLRILLSHSQRSTSGKNTCVKKSIIHVL